MLKGIQFFTIIIVAAILISCSKKISSTVINEPAVLDLKPRSSDVINSSNSFGIELFKQVAATETKNFMLSPLSASAALTMLQNGSAGNTYAQLSNMLGYPADLTQPQINDIYKQLVDQLKRADPSVNLGLANAVWYRNGFTARPEFLSAMQQSFGATVKDLDFTGVDALNTINKWAADNTNNKIPKVLDAIDPFAVMFLMNALYFKGSWTHQFDAKNTANNSFKLESGSSISTPFMSGDIPYKVYNGGIFTGMEFTYGRKNFVMDILVPRTTTVGTLAKSITPAMWSAMVSEYDNSTDSSKKLIYMPKFTFSYEKQLNDVLKALGMKDAFNSSLADFSNLASQKTVVSFVKQNTFVDVNEEGTEAAAVTTIGIVTTSMPSPTYIDKPFVFAIREKTTNTIMFMGILYDPRSN